MTKAELVKLVEAGDFDTFENKCLELIQGEQPKLRDLAAGLEALKKGEQIERLQNLSSVLLEQANLEASPKDSIVFLKGCLSGDPKNPTLREKLIESYQRAYGDIEGFDAILQTSGLNAGRAYRIACRVLDYGLATEPDTYMLNRMSDRAARVGEIDRLNGLITLHLKGRPTTLPISELARDYDIVSHDDFRVLRQLEPERLNELIEKDPVALVIGLLQAHDNLLDQEQLKDELVPRYMEPGAWSKWWTKTRAKLKRNNHVTLEGRSPVVLTYDASGTTLEEEMQQAFEASKEPVEWLSIIDGYLKEKSASKEEPDVEVLSKIVTQLGSHIDEVHGVRPGDALATALIIAQLSEKGLPADDTAKARASTLLSESPDPVRFITDLEEARLWPAALDALKAAKPDTYATHVVEMLGVAPAAHLDRMTEDAVAAEQVNGVQKWIETALDEPVRYPELVYWLWKGPAKQPQVKLPTDEILLSEIVDTLFALGRDLIVDTEVQRVFRQRMKSALALKSFAKLKSQVDAMDVGRAITLRHQLVRVEGLGDTTQGAMLELIRQRFPELWVKPAAKQLEPWEDPDVLFATRAGFERRTRERDDILNVKMRENAKRIGDAAALGDLSENSEYKFALEERDLLRARLAQVNQELSLVEVLEPSGVRTDRVSIGVRVTIREAEGDDQRQLVILGPFEAEADQGIYNYKAPLCLAILGKEIGDLVLLSLDGKDERSYEIVSIENGMHQAELPA